MKEEDNVIKGSILKLVLIIAVIVSLFITIVTRLNIDHYVKYIILPTMSVLVGYTYFVNLMGVKINKKAYFYLAYIFIILLSYFIIPLVEVNKYLNFIVVPILTVIYVFSLINPNFKLNFNFGRWFIKLFPGYLFSNTEYINEAVKETKVNKGSSGVLKGILIGLPIVVVLILLLTSADKYFSSVINNIISLFKFNINIDNLIETIIILVLSFIFVFSTCINIYQMRKAKDFNKKEVDVKNVTSYIILSFVNFVYLLFLVSEISKLTTNFLNVPIEYTYANYAREGFFQLLGVSTINFAIIIFYQNFVKEKDNKNIRNLLLLVVAFSIFIIFNSYYRMGLYIFEYGFTVLRLQVILFLTMELIFFGVLTYKLFNKGSNDKSLKYLIIMLVTYFMNVYLCNELVINYINELWFK